MKIGKFFMRSKLNSKCKVSCETEELKEYITRWIKTLDWKFADFADCVRQACLETPVKFSNWNGNNESFKCLTGTGREVQISLFNLGFECKEQISESEKDSRKYAISENHGQINPEIFLIERKIRKNSKLLECFYNIFLCKYRLTIDGVHQLDIQVNEPGYSIGKEKRIISQNQEEVEQYLLSLDDLSETTKVYEELMQLMNFSEDEIYQTDWIKVCYYEIKGEKTSLRSAIILSRGKIQEYAIFENDETFHVINNGNWRYIGNGMEICYQAKENSYTLKAKGETKQITNITNSVEEMDRIQNKIFQLWWVFNQ